MTARPPAGALAGYTAGAALALFPNQLPRAVLVQTLIVLALGLFGAAAGAAIARAAGRGRAPSDGVCLFTTQLLAAALVAWALWQLAVRTAAGVSSVSPPAFLAMAAAVLVAPYLGAALWASRRRTALAVLAAVVGGATIAWPATASAGPAAPHADRFAAIESGSRGVRVYAALSDGDSPAARAEAAVTGLLESGGAHRRAVVIAVPTGSGWVDPHMVRGVEEAVRGDSAVIAVQYTARPSWQSFLLHRDAAAASATALVEALHRRAPALPVFLYGQSLGAVGVVAARQRAVELGVPIAGTLQVGTPAGVPLVGPAQLNASDPVGVWSPSLLVAPPHRGATAPGRPTPRPPWLPVVSFVQATIDLLGATAPPPGLGHRYDEHQGADLVRPLPPPPRHPLTDLTALAHTPSCGNV